MPDLLHGQAASCDRLQGATQTSLRYEGSVRQLLTNGRSSGSSGQSLYHSMRWYRPASSVLKSTYTKLQATENAVPA